MEIASGLALLGHTHWPQAYQPWERAPDKPRWQNWSKELGGCLGFPPRGIISLRLAPAAITKYHGLGSLNTEMHFLTALEDRSPRSRCQKLWFLGRTLFLACRWPPSSRGIQTKGAGTLPSPPLLIRTSVLWDSGLNVMTSFNLFVSFNASLMSQRVKNLPEMQETQVQPLGQEDPREKKMATHSSILAWRIPWTEEPGGLQSMGSQRVQHD